MYMVFLANRWVSIRTLALGACTDLCVRDTLPGPVMGRLDLPDPPRDEDIVQYEEHHCIVLTPDWWMCEDCGVSFPRDPATGDYPEECIIEGGTPCVAYVPED